MRYVKVVNRTDRPLKATNNGIHYEFAPGAHSLPEIVALALKIQNPIRGSDDEMTGELQYYAGIVDEPYNDPIDPVSVNDEIELYNRRHYKNAQPVVLIDSSSIYRMNKDARTQTLPVDNGFVSPTK